MNINFASRCFDSTLKKNNNGLSSAYKGRCFNYICNSDGSITIYLDNTYPIQCTTPGEDVSS